MRRKGVKHKIRTNHSVRYLKKNEYTYKECLKKKIADVKVIKKCSYCGNRHDCPMLAYEPNHWTIKPNNRNSKINRFRY